MLTLPDNPDWESPEDYLDGWEPWEIYDELSMRHEAGCEYCGDFEIRDNPEPFGGKKCCNRCFNQLIGGEPDDPEFKCGTPYLQRIYNMIDWMTPVNGEV